MMMIEERSFLQDDALAAVPLEVDLSANSAEGSAQRGRYVHAKREEE
jgi:hypothetical protein